MEKVKDTLEKIYYQPGDIVTIRHNIPNKPIMVVKSKSQFVNAKYNGEKNPAPHFHGMVCYWFTANSEYVEKVFNTKDLLHVRELD